MLPFPSSTAIISALGTEAQTWGQYFMPVVYVAVGMALVVLAWRLVVGGTEKSIGSLFARKDDWASQIQRANKRKRKYYGFSNVGYSDEDE